MIKYVDLLFKRRDMTSIDIDPTSTLVRYLLFALNTRARDDIVKIWGYSTTLDFDYTKNDIIVYLMVSGVRQTPSQQSLVHVGKIVDTHWVSTSIKNRLMCVIYSTVGSKYPEEWVRYMIDTLRYDTGVKISTRNGVVTANLSRTLDFNEAYNSVNHAISSSIENSWNSGVIKTANQQLIAKWDLTGSNSDMRIANWVEPRVEMPITRMLLDVQESMKKGETRTSVTLTIDSSPTIRHHIAVWCEEMLKQSVLFTMDKVVVHLTSVQEWNMLVNYIYMDKDTMTGKVQTYRSNNRSLNGENEAVYKTAEGWTRSILVHP